MGKMLACCGLVCDDCDAFIATRKDRDDLRVQTAEKWSKAFGRDIKPGDINCEGCLSEGILFSHCMDCEVRECCRGKKLLNCAYCADYPCSTLEDLQAGFLEPSEARARLEKLKHKLEDKT